MKIGFLFTLFLFLTSKAANFAQQSDWSGEPDVWGPVFEFGYDFFSASSVNWSEHEGSILLANKENALDSVGIVVKILTEDIDGDGDSDVLAAIAAGNGEIRWWENVDGLGVTWLNHEVDISIDGARSVSTADIDGDGDADVLGAALYDDEISWWENVDGTGESWIKHVLHADYDGAYSVHAADIDGDGDADALGAAFYDDEIFWWENVDGSGVIWSKHTVDTKPDGAFYIHSEDMDADGDADVLGAVYSDDEITWWENVDGFGEIWVEHLIAGDLDRPNSLYTADIDGDGDADVLGAGFGGEILCWKNVDGSGETWSKHLIDGYFETAQSVYSGDLDGDGDEDVLGASFNNDEISWWENTDGLGEIWIKHIVDRNFDHPSCAHSADIDGDGDEDVLGAGRWENQISWWDLNSFLSTGSLESSLLDTQEDPSWSQITWSADCPSGTEIGFLVRATESATLMPDWSDTLWNPCNLEDILIDGYSLVQYKVVMKTSDPDFTPVLYDVTISWNSSGNEDVTGAVVSSELLPFAPNPVNGQPVVRFSLISPAEAEFTIFNVSGRVFESIGASNYPAGYGDFLLEELPTGIYICRMTAGDFTGTRRFVVIE